MYTEHQEEIFVYEEQFAPTDPNAASLGISDKLVFAERILIPLYNAGVQIDEAGEHVLVGTSAADTTTLVGSAQNDLILGEGGNDAIVGQSGNDVIYGGTGNDTLKGDTDTDYYIFNADEGRDTIQDADGLGSVRIGGSSGQNLVGGSGDGVQQSVVQGHTTWTSDSEGVTYTLMRGDLSSGAEIKITGASLGGGSITIENFTVSDANPSYLGITLKDQTTLKQTTHGDTLQEGGAKTVKLDLNSVVDTARTIIIRVQGAITDALEAILGDETVPFTDGEIELTLAPGQSEVSFGLLSKGDVDTDQTFTLSASLLKADGSVLAEKRARIERNQAQWLSYVGKRRGEAWPEGIYRGEFALYRGKEKVAAVARNARVGD
jgi:hypothetical protein